MILSRIERSRTDSQQSARHLLRDPAERRPEGNPYANRPEIRSNEIPLLTDLYELATAASYFALGFNRPGVFGMSVCRLPPRRGFLVAAGLERLLEALEQFWFEPARLDYLASLQLFKLDFLDFPGKRRFTRGPCHG